MNAWPRITVDADRSVRLAPEPSVPTFEAETMVRLLFAEHGSIDGLTNALDKLKSDTQSLHAWSLDIIDGYVDGNNIPFPERLHLSVLLATFELELFAMIERWVDFAAMKSHAGPTPRTPDQTAEPP